MKLLGCMKRAWTQTIKYCSIFDVFSGVIFAGVLFFTVFIPIALTAKYNPEKYMNQAKNTVATLSSEDVDYNTVTVGWKWDAEQKEDEYEIALIPMGVEFDQENIRLYDTATFSDGKTCTIAVYSASGDFYFAIRDFANPSVHWSELNAAGWVLRVTLWFCVLVNFVVLFFGSSFSRFWRFLGEELAIERQNTFVNKMLATPIVDGQNSDQMEKKHMFGKKKKEEVLKACVDNIKESITFLDDRCTALLPKNIKTSISNSCDILIDITKYAGPDDIKGDSIGKLNSYYLPQYRNQVESYVRFCKCRPVPEVVEAKKELEAAIKISESIFTDILNDVIRSETIDAITDANVYKQIATRDGHLYRPLIPSQKC